MAVSDPNIQNQIQAIYQRDQRKDDLDGGHVVLGMQNKTVAQGSDVYMLPIPHWLNVLQYPDNRQKWGTKFAMKTVKNAVGIKLSGYQL